jgi:putative ABC transport system ATP-binding protein
MAPGDHPLLQARGVGRVYGQGDLAVRVLYPADLAVRAGEVVVVAGPSGSGKTTLLSILGLVLSPTEGDVFFRGERVSGRSADELARLRRRLIGFVFQQFNLVHGLTAAENVALPLSFGGLPRRERHALAMAALERVGLAGHADRKPRQLSGGQQQRVAIARAVVAQPPLILCDEPTASLDAGSGTRVLELLRTLVGEGGRAVLIVTHDERVIRIADRVVDVVDGRVAERAREDEVLSGHVS